MHSEQEVDRDRGAALRRNRVLSSSSSSSSSSPPSLSREEKAGFESAWRGSAADESPETKRESEKKLRDRRAWEEESDCGCWLLGPRGMMVLFLKHVHLQKTGASGGNDGQRVVA